MVLSTFISGCSSLLPPLLHLPGSCIPLMVIPQGLCGLASLLVPAPAIGPLSSQPGCPVQYFLSSAAMGIFLLPTWVLPQLPPKPLAPARELAEVLGCCSSGFPVPPASGFSLVLLVPSTLLPPFAHETCLSLMGQRLPSFPLQLHRPPLLLPFQYRLGVPRWLPRDTGLGSLDTGEAFSEALTVRVNETDHALGVGWRTA